MKKKLLFIGVILIILILGIYYNRTNINNVNSFNTDNIDIINIMDTDKNYKSTYSIYNTYNKSVEKIFSRKNENFSDFNIDKTNDVIYFSDLNDKRYNIYKVDLLNKDEKAMSLLSSEYSGDVFDFYNDKIIFRTPTKNRISDTLAVYSLTNKTTEVWRNQDSDSTIYNFYWDKDKNTVYTIERSIKEMESTQFPEISTHNIFKYDENGENKQLLYSTNKYIDNISVNKQGDKIIFDASTIENNRPIKKIYLLDLDNNTDKIVIESNVKYESTNFDSIKDPQISLNKDGFYFLATTPKSKVIENIEGSMPIMSNSIYYYDFSSKAISIIFEDDKIIINKFKLS